MATGEAVIQVGENGEIIAMLLERFESRRKVVLAPRLVLIRKEGLLVDAVVVGKADHAFDWLLSLFQSRAARRDHGFQHGKGEANTTSTKEGSSI